ncbi:MAG TPA: iron-containing redox enzyme family protein [Kofleriaceae bacterium]|nr:iron-containing redox enzyme family protein [Kofleriaceae bacterium]
MNDAAGPGRQVVRARAEIDSALQAFWARASMEKLETKFKLGREMAAIPQLPIEALRAILLQYRYFTRAFITDLSMLVARCPDSRLRSLLGQLVDEELGMGDPDQAHARLYDRFLESIGALDPGASDDDRAALAHPKVSDLLGELHRRTSGHSTWYAIGMRGLGGECVCGVYFGVMHNHLREHPYIVEHQAAIDWTFWDIHAGHADVEHNELVRAAVGELIDRQAAPHAVTDLGDGFDFGSAMWDAFWTAVYREQGVPVS